MSGVFALMEASQILIDAQKLMLRAQGKHIAMLEEQVRNLCRAIETDSTRLVDTYAVRMGLEPTSVPEMDTQPPEVDRPINSWEGRPTLEVPNVPMDEIVERGLR